MRLHRALSPVLLPVCLTLCACQENVLKHIEPDSALGQPELAVSPEIIDFGLAAEGAVRTETFTLSSFGDVPVQIGGVYVSGASAFTLTWPGPQSLEPGEELDVVVSWTPQSFDDEAHVLIESDALTPQLGVDLLGQGLYPGISVDPGSISFLSDYGESDERSLTVHSIGTTDLVVSQTLLTGSSFAIDTGATGGQFTLAPGAELTFPVTYTPPGEGDISTGAVWFSTNTADPDVTVPLFGETDVPCYGLGEAWDRGVLDVDMIAGNALRLQNTGSREGTSASSDPAICMDQWYVFLSSTSQDAIAGDPDFDLSGDYPFGSISIDAGEGVAFAYADPTDDAWWCIEHEQYTRSSAGYTFEGARAPDRLLDRALAADQDGLWALQEVEPVIALGRTVHYVELGSGESGEGGIVAFNLGEVATETTVTETIPPGFEATGFSLEPDSTGISPDGGITCSWTLQLDGRQVGEGHGNTVYDREEITWTLTRTGSCSARVTAPEAIADWQDSDGAQTSSANPMIIRCM